ncbi:MAG: glycoside hydrolase family 130 protein [Desulfobacterales bacterium]|nr:MAG: glycoside hydrolase family 130 protein [Desulfobacterales bacterium]
MNKLYPFKRYEKNPILCSDDVPYPCNTVFNAAAYKFQNQYLLLLRIEDLKGHSHLTLAHSDDGYQFKVDSQPWITPSDDPYYEPYERFGVEDPRITLIEDTYYITYTAYGPFGPRVGIGSTKDFVSFERISLATEVDNKDAILFPEKIDGSYAMIDRPGGMGGQMGAIWITYSKDLIHWGRARAILGPAPGWGPSKLGISTPPLKTDRGWFTLYHGVRETASGRLYRIGAMLLDLTDPSRISGYTEHFIFGPEELYERTGDVPNVVFPCGIILESDGTLKMYYGAADTCIAVAEAKLDHILKLCSNRI